MIEQQRRRVKKIYTISLLVSLSLGLAFAFYLMLTFPDRSAPNRVGHILVSLSWLLSNFVALQMCQITGASLEGRSIEIMRRRATAAPQDDFLVAELRTPREHWLSLALLFSLLGSLAFAFGLACDSSADRVWPFLVAASFGVGAAALWTAYARRRGLMASIDAQGVRKKHFLVPWNHIETCHITLKSNLFGKLSTSLFTFKNHNDNTLLRIDTAALPPHQAQHFKAVIQCYLPDQ